jgi:hypothetical protein
VWCRCERGRGVRRVDSPRRSLIRGGPGFLVEVATSTLRGSAC